MSIRSACSTLEHLERVLVENMRWISLTSRLATVPSAGQSERSSGALPASLKRPRIELVQTFERVWEASVRMCKHPPERGIGPWGGMLVPTIGQATVGPEEKVSWRSREVCTYWPA